MQIILISIGIFFAGYFVNMFYITVFYHRALAHKSLIVNPSLLKFIVSTGPWLTGIDPKGWICMHRMHHLHSDKPGDPHSPVQNGVLGVALRQLKSYERALRGLIIRRREYTSLVQDLTFDVHYLNGRRRWVIPYVLHILIGVALGFLLRNPLPGIAYYFGIMSHPIQGWMVNSLAHYYGYRNFETNDNSRNNRWVAWLVSGEGYQNNHHTFPHRANFGIKFGEVDLGYVMCFIPVLMGLAKFPTKLIANQKAENMY